MSQPWMPFYVADYLADTTHLSAAEHGAYLLLIMHYWRAGSLPTDERQLQRIARMTVREWSNSRDTLASFFDADWRHKRIENELLKSQLKSTARAEAGSRGGKAKALKNNDAGLANATILPEQKPAVALASSSQSQSDVSSLRSETTRANRASPSGFDDFWLQYPNKVGKGAALKAFIKARSRADQPTIMAGLARYAAKQDDRPWCNPATWLNQDRWLDVPAAQGPPTRQKNITDLANEIIQENGYERAEDQGFDGANQRIPAAAGGFETAVEYFPPLRRGAF